MEHLAVLDFWSEDCSTWNILAVLGFWSGIVPRGTFLIGGLSYLILGMLHSVRSEVLGSLLYTIINRQGF